MKKLNRSFHGPALLAVAILAFFSSKTYCQAPVYDGALLYSMPWQTSVPPLYAGQPPQITTAYLWLDDLMRLDPEYKIEAYFNTLSWNDTAKTIASNLYQIQDDNPLSYFMWSGSGLKPYPYQAVPGRAELAFIQKVSHIAGDTQRSSALLFPEIIADVMVSDTFCKQRHDTLTNIIMDYVLVNSTILDEIKGKMVPLCVGEDMRARGKGNFATLNTPAIPWATYAVPADTGTCLQFQYSPEWPRDYSNGDEGGPPLIDSSGGWWVKPGHEYIVFLYFEGTAEDTANEYFTVWAGGGRTSGGMYPVIAGIVQDPNDDFGIGAGVSGGLSVADWKSRVRARINSLVHP